jgi:hypothetical protein
MIKENKLENAAGHAHDNLCVSKCIHLSMGGRDADLLNSFHSILATNELFVDSNCSYHINMQSSIP